ncbi:MAG: ankyrin repeat domain-containing protein, partial [Candidatus Poribacteria bacterium]|nr:ankyrin repeat domain-containing protein [Candidatus Poribacteria bacterium]
PYTYVEASVSIDGVVFPKVGLRKKGFIGSQSHTRPSLKVKLNHINKKDGIEGLTNLTLNNNKQDTSLVSQFMGYALFNAIGSPAPRCAYAKVTVNGENLGIYSHVETVRKPLLKRAFGNSKGALYEGTVVDFYENWENSFEHKRGDDARGRAQINALIDLLADPKATETDIGELVDLESFYRFWATEGLVGFWDGYSGNKNNFFVYLNPDDDKFYFLPWGMDSIFTKMSKLEFMNDRRAPISVKTQGLIAYKLYQFENGRRRYAEALTEILDNHWDAPELLAALDKIAVMVEPHLVPAQRTIAEEWEGGRGAWQGSDKPTFTSELDEVRDFIRNRESDIQAEIADGMPVWRKRPDPPFVIPKDGDSSKMFLKFIENTLAGAARDGDLEAIKQHIAEGADVNALHFEMPPLTWAAMMGQTDAAELLLQQGADINGRNRDGNTALHLAAFLGRAETAELLLKNGVDVNARNDDGGTPVDILGTPWEMTRLLSGPMGIKLKQKQVESGKAKIREMFSTGAKIGDQTSPKVQNNSTDLWTAARTGDLQAIKRYIEEDGNINALDKAFQLSAMSWSALYGQTEVVQLLIENGVDVNIKSGDGTTPLHSAAFLGRTDVAKLLLDNGADIKTRNNDGATPADVLFVNWETTTFIGSLIGVDIKKEEATVMKGRNEIAKLFGIDGVSNEAGTFSAQRLSEAAFTGDLTTMKQALTQGADVNTMDPQSGSTLLATAALMGHTKVVSVLLEHGADVNARSRDGGTALHAAAFLGRAETVKLLLEKGADATLRNNMGSTAIDGAKLDWTFTKGIIGMLQIKVDEAEVKAGRAEVIKLISQHNRK